MLRKTDERGFVGCALFVSAALVAACGGSAAPAAAPPSSDGATSTPAAASDAPSSDAPAAADSGSTAPANGTDSGSAPASKGPPSGEKLSLVALCNKGCDKMKATCSASSVDNCRMNCTQYEHPPAGCDDEIRAALECANKAEDTTCVNIAPEICSPKFRRIVACANGGKTVETTDEAAQTPAGWERYSSKKNGFASMMPKGVAEGTDGGVPTSTVKQGELTYQVRVLPAPAERPTQKSMVKLALPILGKCSQKLKLYGMVDRPEKIFIRFDSHCPDGTDWRGAFVITDKKMWMPFVTIPKGANGPKNEIDAFVYGFELEK
ncbi:MAG TPA: hypothetical protein VFQ35_21725 [Polyangiaceae bacterium]|nr:hypothetical protein [Polyangiaceae bacterium]